MSFRKAGTSVASPKQNKNDGAVAITTTRFDDEKLLAIGSFDDALSLLAEEGIVVDAASETLGNGFSVIQDKGVLVGAEMILLSWQFNQGDMGEFVSINAVVKLPGHQTPAKLVINDGSTGIRDDLKKYTERTGKTAGLYVKKGLRRSDYDYTDEKTGETRGATTFYLDTSA